MISVDIIPLHFEVKNKEKKFKTCPPGIKLGAADYKFDAPLCYQDTLSIAGPPNLNLHYTCARKLRCEKMIKNRSKAELKPY